MGNTSLKPSTREALREYAQEDASYDDAVVALLAKHELLLSLQRECELLRRLVD